jgi:hypothetical protein
LEKHLIQEKIAALSLEIRNYPTPIARCDQHLAALLDERARLIAELKELENPHAA